jgi:hypothetical protein
MIPGILRISSFFPTFTLIYVLRHLHLCIKYHGVGPRRLGEVGDG